jgi:ice-binding like protein/exosortase sorting signal-containing protein
MVHKFVRVVVAAGFASLLCGVAVWAQASLGTAQSFAVLGGSTVTNTGPSVLTGDLGVSPGGAITGFPPGTATGVIHTADAVALQAQNDVITQYNTLASLACTADLTGQDLGGKTLTSGVYCFSTSAQLTGPLVLNAQGNASATFVFKTGSTLTTASASSVSLINGGNPCGVAWQIGTSATLGTTTSFIGNLIALSSITLNTGANIIGRALARNGAVTLDTNNISFAACAVAGVPPPVPTLTTWAMIVLVGLLALAGFATLRKRQFPSGPQAGF